MRFSIAGVGFELVGLEPADLAELEVFLAAFRTAAAPRFTLRRQRVDWPAHQAARTMPQLEGLMLRGEDFEAQVTADGATLRAPPGRFPVELMVKVLLARELLERGGVVVHGAAVATASGALVASGPSGAGKSTFARNAAAAGLTVLGDELVALVPGAGGRFEAMGTPWNTGAAASRSLKGVAVIAWSAAATLTPVPLERLAGVWLKNAVVPENSAACRQAVTRALLAAMGSCANLELAVPDSQAAGEAAERWLLHAL